MMKNLSAYAATTAFALLPALAVAQSESGNGQFAQVATVFEASCPLECYQSSPCVRGNANFSHVNHPDYTFPFASTLHEGGFHCECPPGRTGVLCEREYQTCGDGEHFCFHGGKCLPGMKDPYGNEQHYCDCSDAEFNGKKFAGKFCEAEAVDPCGTSIEHGEVFCTNGGKCKQNYLQHLEQPCVCSKDFEGPHCEYKKGDMPVCNLHCFNGGTCEYGVKSYPENPTYNQIWDNEADLRYCSCPEGFFGLFCQIEGKKCGDNHCFNGGSCVARDMPDGSRREFCDCSTAHTDEISFAGRYCEAESTSFCTKMPDHNGHQFCVNGGTCKAESHLGCDCLDGFNGPICEFRDSEMESSECNLQCKHNGVCRNGAKDVSFLEKFDVHKIENMQSAGMTYSAEFEHCVCPKGYVGIQCEHMVDVCPGGEQICMNGASCVPTNIDGHLSFECDCNSIHSPFFKFGGDMCDLKSDEICTFDGRPGRGKNEDAFCLNGGKCKKHSSAQEEHAGCRCPKGFHGPHCEFDVESGFGENPRKPKRNDEASSEERTMSAMHIVLMVLAIDLVIVGIGLTWFMIKRGKTSRTTSFGYPRSDNIMAIGVDRMPPPPPTLEGILSMSQLSTSSLDSRSESGLTSTSEAAKFQVSDINARYAGTDSELVNVQII